MEEGGLGKERGEKGNFSSFFVLFCFVLFCFVGGVFQFIGGRDCGTKKR